jgi:hypothetical protein
MKAEDLKVGQWYSIDYKDPKHPEDNWVGNAKFVQKNPPNYEPNTLEFVCEDGEQGVFDIDDVIGLTPDTSSFDGGNI